MDQAIEWEGLPIDRTLLERANPVFQTAKMTLFQLAACGDEDAAVLVKRMGLTREKTQNSSTTVASPEQILGGMIMLETRYRTIEALALRSGYALVDMPCGYTPRGARFARRGIPYVGLDLPAVIQETEPEIRALLPEEQRKLIRYRAVDATNYASLEKALEDVDGPVCITTEGLLMYFTDSEAGVLCDNVRRILERKGGCWFTADPESSLQYILTMRALVGDRFAEIMKNAAQQTKDKSDVEIGKNSLIFTAPHDIAGEIKRVTDILAQHGLAAERVTVADYLPELSSLTKVSPEQAAAVREGQKRCGYWKITSMNGAAAQSVDATAAGAEGLEVSAAIQAGTLSMAFAGRLDTITAPNLLAFYEKTAAEHPLSAVSVDCSRLEYISSAGLRVLLIMHKGCKDGVSLYGVNQQVREILEQTGFDAIFGIL